MDKHNRFEEFTDEEIYAMRWALFEFQKVLSEEFDRMQHSSFIKRIIHYCFNARDKMLEELTEEENKRGAARKKRLLEMRKGAAGYND